MVPLWISDFLFCHVLPDALEYLAGILRCTGSGIILEIGGYVGEAAVQSSSALFSIRLCFVWIPIVVFIACFVILRFYNLDKKFDGIIRDLHERAAGR